MNLYNGFCYETLTEAANADLSTGPYNYNNGLASASSFSAASAESVTMTYDYVSPSSSSSFNLVRTYPSCASVGYSHNYLGVTLDDAIETSGLVITVWAVAWAINSLRRAK